MAPCDRDKVDLGLLSNIHEIWTASGCTYGADRVHPQLRRDGIRVGRKCVERLMAREGRQGAYLRRGWKTGSTTRRHPDASPAADLVERNFTAAEPDRLWVADATKIPYGQGAFWLAAVRDAYSRLNRRLETSDRCDTDLVLGALEYAVWTRRPDLGQTIHHSDHGSNYTSFRFGQTLADLGITASGGTVGESFDNALMENFFSTLKTELVYRTAWAIREQVTNPPEKRGELTTAAPRAISQQFDGAGWRRSSGAPGYDTEAAGKAAARRVAAWEPVCAWMRHIAR